MAIITFEPPPTLERFMLSEAFFRLAAGPVGSSKTTACIFELLRRSAAQSPSQDGIRHTRWAIIRQTLQQLKMTVLKDVLQWLPGITSWKVSDSTIYVEMGDVQSEWILIPLEDPEDQRRLLSSQLTGAWISECIEIDADLVAAISARCGRYPGANMGGCTWRGIIADTNFPEEGTPWHDRMENPPPDWQIFKQPGGLSAGAENLQWLLQTAETLKLAENDPVRLAQGRSYYEQAARGQNKAWINRYVNAQYGIDPSGSAVFKESFQSAVHVVSTLEPVDGMMLLIGQDFGRDPCSIIGQMDHRGTLRILDEVIADDIGLEQHIRQNLRPRLMNPRYLGRPIAIIGDPSGVAKGSIYEISSFDCLKGHGFHAFPASTNNIDPRLRAVESFLLQSMGGVAGMLIDRSRCPTLVRAMNGGYRFAKMKSGENKALPDKGNYSHIADALQYLCLGAVGGSLAMIQRRFTRGPRQVNTSAAGWT